MGGFVQEDESVDDAAKRVLFELTGLTNVFMELEEYALGCIVNTLVFLYESTHQ